MLPEGILEINCPVVKFDVELLTVAILMLSAVELNILTTG